MRRNSHARLVSLFLVFLFVLGRPSAAGQKTLPEAPTLFSLKTKLASMNCSTNWFWSSANGADSNWQIAGRRRTWFCAWTMGITFERYLKGSYPTAR